MKTVYKFQVFFCLTLIVLITSSFVSKPKIGLSIGNVAPELAFNNPKGEEIKLSSLRGQFVLIDFWASWCGPCRKENKNVVKTYQTYKDKSFTNGEGFTVYNVSLDTNPKKWEKAILKDKLEWNNHVSDLKRPAEGAMLYQVRGIPSNFLIDGDGIIIAKNLRGETLDQALEKHLKK